MRKLVALLLALATAPAAPLQGAASRGSADDVRILRIEEYRLKAEFLERFTHFVKWPDRHEQGVRTTARAEAGRPFRLCLIGTDPFGDSLQELARDHRIDARRIELRQLQAPAEAAGCQLLFISSSERDRLEPVLAATRGNGVLTVADSEGFAARGVLINLFVTNDKIGFEVNEQVARREGFEISARLLKLARRVGEGDGR
ncbi:MAG TPA: YfiR family protein [Thermoanaerobaculia bacterium]|nr:YfiR family protein [Thermoanaerobaculia bacterium]